jgi:hypothetical protein
MWTQHHLKSGHTLTATVVDGNGYVRDARNQANGGIITNSSPKVFGPYFSDHLFETQGIVTVTIAEADSAANIPSAGQKALLDAIPEADQEDSETVWNDEGTLKVSGAGA